jgi:uncharacterized membrane protein (TIGR02234 family)
MGAETNGPAAAEGAEQAEAARHAGAAAGTGGAADTGDAGPADAGPADGPAAAPAARRAGRRELTVTVLIALLGGVLAWAAAGRPWASAVVGTAPNTVKVTAGGNDLSGGVTALGLTALAGGLALFATRRLARRLVGVLLVAAGAGAAAYAVGERGAGHASRVLADKAAARGVASGTLDVHLASWWLLAVLGGLLVVLAGVAAVLRGGSWPGMSSRYENAAAKGAARPADAGSAKDLWDALDRGEDPTEAAAADVASLTATPGTEQ